MAPPVSASPATAAAASVVSPVVALVVRILTFIFLLISVIILGINSVTITNGVEIKFNDFYVYRYMLASAIIGIAYTLLQTAFIIFEVRTGNRIGGELLHQLEFYGDKVISYMLATGAAAGFGFTVDVKRTPGNNSDTEDFLDKANAAASLLFMGFLFSAVSSVFSSLSLPKRS